MPPAARVTDFHQCNMPTPTPHVGGPVLPPASPTVVTGFLPQARATDKCTCAGPPDFIVTGSGSVLIDGLNAARKTDRTMHQPAGTVMMGFASVDIGGPTVGVTLGGVRSATSACAAAATTRIPAPGAVDNAGNPLPAGTTKQSYNNCGIESSRQIINTVSPPGITQEQLLTQATTTTGVPPGGSTAQPLAVTGSSTYNSGGTWDWSQQAILQNNGVPSQMQAPTSANVTQGVAEGRGVIANLDASFIWGAGTPPGAWHAVLVTGAQYDANGNLLNLIINDTGNNPPNNCGASYSAATIQSAMTAHGGNIVTTNNRVWPP